MESEFSEGDVVVVSFASAGDIGFGINLGSEGVVRHFCDGIASGTYVEFIGVDKQPNSYYWKDGARWMFDGQLRLVRRFEESEKPQTDHLDDAVTTGKCMDNKFEVGKRVEVVWLDSVDRNHGIEIGWKGVVTENSDFGNPFVKFDNPTKAGITSGKRGDSILMLKRQLIESADPVQPHTDHLSAVSAATLDYQRLLREYADAEKAKDAAYEALNAAEKLQRDTGLALNKARIALNKAHYDAAGVEFKQ